jgi:uncharacterized protein YbbC (DUF1343 family)
MKKILSSFIICILLFSSISPVFSAENNYSQYLPRVTAKIQSMTPSEIRIFQQSVAELIAESDNQEIKDFLTSILLLTTQEEASNTPLYTELSSFEQSRVATQISKLQ